MLSGYRSIAGLSASLFIPVFAQEACVRLMLERMSNRSPPRRKQMTLKQIIRPADSRELCFPAIVVFVPVMSQLPTATQGPCFSHIKCRILKLIHAPTWPLIDAPMCPLASQLSHAEHRQLHKLFVTRRRGGRSPLL